MPEDNWEGQFFKGATKHFEVFYEELLITETDVWLIIIVIFDSQYTFIGVRKYKYHSGCGDLIVSGDCGNTMPYLDV